MWVTPDYLKHEHGLFRVIPPARRRHPGVVRREAFEQDTMVIVEKPSAVVADDGAHAAGRMRGARALALLSQCLLAQLKAGAVRAIQLQQPGNDVTENVLLKAEVARLCFDIEIARAKAGGSPV